MSSPGTPKYGANERALDGVSAAKNTVVEDDFDAPVVNVTAAAAVSAPASGNSSASEPEVVKEYATFDAMDLPLDLLRGIYGYGFEKPSEIQRKVIVPMKNRRDTLAQAPSGTGKTGGFLIGDLATEEADFIPRY
jgi:hypothetical protein